jgi:ssDNA-binding Zn-finger/Zn-ribbon topoisomerase 1
MARNTFSMNQTSKDRPEYFICPKCGKKLDISNFYTHSRKPMGILPICKTCMYDMVLDETGVNRQGMIALMKYLDMPFIQKEYEECVNKNTNSPKRAVSVYMNLKMTKNEYVDLRFKDSMYDVFVDLDLKEEPVGISLDNDRVDLLEEEISPQQAKIQRAKELKAKWGNFDSLDYLERCERLYIEIVQGGYVIASSMHDLSVRNYCKLQVDWDIAQETKDYNAMRELKQPLKDARTDAKLNPSQFKAGDFQNGGANSFGEITRMVAKRDGFIPLPMKFFKQPNDQLDWMMLELVNYDRSVLGLPEVTYEELYKHYIERIEKFNREYNADIENGDLGDLDPDTKGKKKHYTLI